MTPSEMIVQLNIKFLALNRVNQDYIFAVLQALDFAQKYSEDKRNAKVKRSY